MAKYTSLDLDVHGAKQALRILDQMSIRPTMTLDAADRTALREHGDFVQTLIAAVLENERGILVVDGRAAYEKGEADEEARAE